jgi:indolepyruvate ferredoxin oxidoreductase, beta subunit
MSSMPERQQIFLSGVGGQGILFITRLLAETAIYKGNRILTAETHGMAQRGGVVVSHVKVGDFSSPLIKPGRADVVFLLKSENLAQHRSYARPGGAIVVNASSEPDSTECFWTDADAVAREIDQQRSMNLVLAGFAVSALKNSGQKLFCSVDEIRAVLGQKLAGRDKLLVPALAAFDRGVSCGERNTNIG